MATCTRKCTHIEEGKVKVPCRDFELLLKFDDELALMLGMWIDIKLRALGDDISDYVKVNCIIHEACTMLVPEKEKKKIIRTGSILRNRHYSPCWPNVVRHISAGQRQSRRRMKGVSRRPRQIY